MLCCAHAIFYFKLQEEEQNSFLVHENIYLIFAATAKEARALGEERAKANEDVSSDGHLQALNEKKVSYLFAGIRKIIDVQSQPSERVLTELIEVEFTYSVYEVDTLEEVLRLARGEMVNVLYRE